MTTPRVLVVGAGGIGCEVLKNLVLSGFRHIELVDMDSIDVSNLNRQFLFTKEDVGKSKAETAARAISLYLRDPNELQINTHVSRIQDLPTALFKSCDFVVNALDNIEARKYVNAMCVAMSKSLYEAGSTGANGQSYPLFPHAKTECFSCRSQPKVNVYPVCTIRLSPEKPEHCIAWARYLYESLYEGSANALDDVGALLNSEALDKTTEDGRLLYAKRAAEYLFVTQIQQLLESKELAEKEASDKAPPKLPHTLAWITTELERIGDRPDQVAQLTTPESDEARVVQSDIHYLHMFLRALMNCTARSLEGAVSVKFEKDVSDIMSFVCAASNLRMLNYDIPIKCFWDSQSIAGSIQPAIASTNAIVAGLQVINCTRMLALAESKRAANLEEAMTAVTAEEMNNAGMRFVWSRANVPAGGRLLLSERLEPPNAECPVCQQNVSSVRFRCFEDWTLREFIERVLKPEFGAQDDLTIQNTAGVLYDLDMAEDHPQMVEKTLDKFNVGRCSIWNVTWLTGSADILLEEDGALNSREFAATVKDVADANQLRQTTTTSTSETPVISLDPELPSHKRTAPADEDHNKRLKLA